MLSHVFGVKGGTKRRVPETVKARSVAVKIDRREKVHKAKEEVGESQTAGGGPRPQGSAPSGNLNLGKG